MIYKCVKIEKVKCVSYVIFIIMYKLQSFIFYVNNFFANCCQIGNMPTNVIGIYTFRFVQNFRVKGVNKKCLGII